MSEHGLGGRLPLLAAAGLDPAQRRFHASAMAVEYPWSVENGFRLTTDDGRFIGPYNAFLRGPEVADGFREFSNAAARSTTLSPQLREVVILAVGSVWASSYETYAHRIIARAVGISDDDAKAIVAGRVPEHLGPDARLLTVLVQQLAGEHAVERAVYDEALTAFGERGLVDIAALVGQYMVVCGFLALFDVPAPTDEE